MEELLTLHNRQFSRSDITLICRLIESDGDKGRTFISKQLCELWNWRTPGGQLRDITCREVLRKLDKRGLICLPPMLRPARRIGYKNKTKLPAQINTGFISCSLKSLLPLSIQMVRGTSREKLYNGLIGAYHYLDYFQGSGEQLKYVIFSGDRQLACIGFGASAFKIAPRDDFIGWSHQVRQQNLFKIVNNNRFLILPWVKVKNLASYILASVSRRIVKDWFDYYQHDIVLLETFVQRDRFFGTCYKAANWLYLGHSKGRGRNDRYSQYRLAIKDIYVYPLVKDYKQRLRQIGGIA